MSAKKRVIRLIVEDHEDVIYWDEEISQSLLHELIVYINDQLRKKYSTDTFSYRDFENKHYQLNQIAEFEISPVFLAIPHRKDVLTSNKVDPRTMKNVYIFKDINNVRVQKFENLNRYEELEISMETIRKANASNKAVEFEDPILSADVGKLKIEIQKPVEVEEQKDSPTFGKKTNNASNKNNGFLQADNLVKQDLGKKTNYHLPDAKGHNEFLKMTEMNKNPTGKEVELKLYTLDDVKLHNRSNDAWIVINGKVYDITKYIPYHPGGNKILMGVGKDGTSLYNKYHPWVNANYLLEKYQIGFLKK